MAKFMQQMTDTYLPDILHAIAQGLLIPTMVALLLLLAATLFFLGQILLEFFTERRAYKQNMPKIVNDVNDAGYAEIEQVVASSKLLRFQKAALITCTRNMGLDDEALFALAQIEIGKAEKRYRFKLAWTDTMSKIAPLLGLMGTLIPLGPGMVALGQNDVAALSSSLLLAFDATVCGLLCAIVSLAISKIRSGWYSAYISTLESLMSVVVDRAAQARAAGIALPKGYAGDVMKEFREAQKQAPAGGQSQKQVSGGAQPQKQVPPGAQPQPQTVKAKVEPVDLGDQPAPRPEDRPVPVKPVAVEPQPQRPDAAGVEKPAGAEKTQGGE